MQKYIKYCYLKNIHFSVIHTLIISIMMGLSAFACFASSKETTPQTIETAPQKTIEQPDKSLKKIDGFTPLGVFKAWEAFSMITQDEIVCWVSSENIIPKKLKATQKPSSLMLSIRLENTERDEFSYHSQYNLEPETKLNMTIDKVVSFKLLPQGHWAWLKSSIDESRFVLSAQKGTNLMLSGKTTNDKTYKETYSLSGFTTAYKTAFEACHKEIEKKSMPRTKPSSTSVDKLIKKQ